MKKLLIILLIISVIIVIAISFKGESISYKKISSKEAHNMMKNDVVILDVREEFEYDQSHIKNSVNIPVNSIEKIDIDKNKTLLVYCRTGNRSKIASEKLIKLGYINVYDFGGIEDWPYEVEKGD